MMKHLESSQPKILVVCRSKTSYRVGKWLHGQGNIWTDHHIRSDHIIHRISVYSIVHLVLESVVIVVGELIWHWSCAKRWRSLVIELLLVPDWLLIL